MTGMDAIELGHGTAYASAWMVRREARVVGIDNSERQLATARRLAGKYRVELELIHGNAETVPYADASFDFAVSEYGAAWADPAVWVPEAWRLLRPGGGLAFFTNHPLAQVCSPLDGSLPIAERLERPHFGMYRFDWRDAVDEPGGIEFNMPISEWFRVLTDTGFVVVDCIEVRAPHAGSDMRDYATADWADQWPAEMAWIARKPSWTTVPEWADEPSDPGASRALCARPWRRRGASALPTHEMPILDTRRCGRCCSVSGDRVRVIDWRR